MEERTKHDALAILANRNNCSVAFYARIAAVAVNPQRISLFLFSVVKMEGSMLNSDLQLGSQEIISDVSPDTVPKPIPTSSLTPRICIEDDDDENSMFVSYSSNADHSYCK